ncbi:SRPBCC domain-containing protein [Phenylobacterium sp.]|uniref:SRPBCC domain-containing protein n=1 Tax=Phenylobacterium sp. TaxID=1871053 RepID=UPI0027307614|nr:SRPBCC domain-containing protein [Phenylobacterium sp.]MDP1598465.1 SRPBCC domain-containing protein [Phenylobacterium sp.]MDP3591351.1 SRPBCC domain-containing protein [Phenylobacterium sp.]
MIVETEIEISAPPIRVWRALCDFEAYSKWNPYREIRGEAGPNEKVKIFVGSDPARRYGMRAVICHFEPGKRISFRTGNPLFSRATETFSLEPIRKGTLLRHSAEMTGVSVLVLGRGRIGSRLINVYRRVDSALAKYVTLTSQPDRRAERHRRGK